MKYKKIPYSSLNACEVKILITGMRSLEKKMKKIDLDTNWKCYQVTNSLLYEWNFLEDIKIAVIGIKVALTVQWKSS